VPKAVAVAVAGSGAEDISTWSLIITTRPDGQYDE
jgi:hypothetical protein